MIYLDTSVALAQLLAEDRKPPAELWSGVLVSSRLLEYEVWTRIHGRAMAKTLTEAVEALLARIAFLELVRPVLTRALEPFPKPVRTLDALHLASIDFLTRQGQRVQLASYDERLRGVATAMGVALVDL